MVFYFSLSLSPLNPIGSHFSCLTSKSRGKEERSFEEGRKLEREREKMKAKIFWTFTKWRKGRESFSAFKKRDRKGKGQSRFRAPVLQPFPAKIHFISLLSSLCTLRICTREPYHLFFSLPLSLFFVINRVKKKGGDGLKKSSSSFFSHSF